MGDRWDGTFFGRILPATQGLVRRGILKLRRRREHPVIKRLHRTISGGIARHAEEFNHLRPGITNLDEVQLGGGVVPPFILGLGVLAGREGQGQ